jgi:hypothetical protein
MPFRRQSLYKKTEQVPVGQVPSDYAGWATMAGGALGGKFGEAGAERWAEETALGVPWLDAYALPPVPITQGLAEGVGGAAGGAAGYGAASGIGATSAYGVAPSLLAPGGVALAEGSLAGGFYGASTGVGAGLGGAGTGLGGAGLGAATITGGSGATLAATGGGALSPGALTLSSVAPAAAAGPPGWAVGLMVGGAALLGSWLGGLFEPEPETEYEDVFVEPVPIGGAPEEMRDSQLPSPMQFASMPEKSDTAPPPLSQYGIQNLPGFNT